MPGHVGHGLAGQWPRWRVSLGSRSSPGPVRVLRVRPSGSSWLGSAKRTRSTITTRPHLGKHWHTCVVRYRLEQSARVRRTAYSTKVMIIVPTPTYLMVLSPLAAVSYT